MTDGGSTQHTPIAVIGMAALFPGAPDLETYWQNIVGGVDAIGEVPPARWDPDVFGAAPEEPAAADRFPCRRGGFVDGDAWFDPQAFGVMPVAVDDAEPDQLLALRIAADAISDAGGSDAVLSAPERVGVVLGRGGYLTPGLARIDQRVRVANQVAEVLRQVVPDLDPAQVDEVRRAFQAQLGPERPESTIGLVPNLAASRIANRLDLQGPAFTVDAACASSLVAIDHAVRELRSQRCDVMLAGGTHHCHDVTLWSVFTQLGALSRRQQIRPFHRDADGLLIGEGTGVVVLKRLADAERDGNRIYAVVRGTGVASDGRDASLMKPKVAGQVLALQRAWADAGDHALDPHSIGLVEAHGTATPSGDEAELQTLARFFGEHEGGSRPRAGLGSVKSMIGHAMPAAGIAGFIKAALALHHQVLPPTLHADEPHEALAATRFRLVTEAEPWELRSSKTPLRRAAVNAFGFGGINAHIVLDEAPDSRSSQSHPRRAPESLQRTEGVLVLAAASVEELVARLDAPDTELMTTADVGLGLPAGPVRLALVRPDEKRLALTRKIVAQGKRWLGRNDVWFSPAPRLGSAGGGQVAFLLPGVEPTFDPRVDDIAEWFGWPAPEEVDAEHLGFQGRAIVEVGRLLHRAMLELGVQPDHLAGHSIGEWTGMVTSELIPPEAVDEFIGTIDPGELEVPGVVFAAMGCGAHVAEGLIAGLPDVVVSHDNCPHQSIICGASESVLEAIERGKVRKVMSQTLPFRSGFHSPMFEAYLGPVRDHLDRLPLQAATVPLWSSTIIERYPDDPAAVRDLAVRHLLEPVRFQPLLVRLREEGVTAFVQLGVGSLTAFADDTLQDDPALTLTATTPKRSGLDQLRRVLAGLWAEGLDSVRFDRLPAERIATDVPTSTPAARITRTVGRPASAMTLRLGAPLVSLDGVALAGFEREVGSARDTSSGGRGDVVHQWRASGDPVLAEMGAVFVETTQATEDLLALLDGTTPPDGGAAPASTSGEADTNERLLDISVAAMPYLLDHCFYRQPEGWPHAADRFPVVPMTALVDLFAREAERAVPGTVAIAVNDMRAFRWTAAAPPVEAVLRTTIDRESDGSARVRVFLDGYAWGTVTVADRYPDPPPVDRTPLSGEATPEVDAVELYEGRWMFHGPAYQGISEISAVADDGIRGVITVPEAPGALLDNAGQLMGYWVMQRVEDDRLALPTSVGSFEFFGPHPAAGTELVCTVWVDAFDDIVARTHMDLADRATGALWCRVTAWEDKRFDSDDVVWPLLRYPEHHDLAEPHPGGWVLVHERWRSSASRELMMRRYTDEAERDDYDGRNPRDQRQWLLGRVAAKDAVRRFLWSREDARSALFPIEVGIEHDERGRPFVAAPAAAAELPISVAHTEWVAVAMVGEPGGASVGIDIERVEERASNFASMTLTDRERALFPDPTDHDLTRLWAVKEAAAKAAGTGLEGKPKQFEIVETDGTRLRVADRWIDTTTLNITTHQTEGEFVVAWTSNH